MVEEKGKRRKTREVYERRTIKFTFKQKVNLRVLLWTHKVG